MEARGAEDLQIFSLFFIFYPSLLSFLWLPCLLLLPLAFSARATGKSNRLEQQGVMGKLLLLHLSSWGTVARATGKGNRY